MSIFVDSGHGPPANVTPGIPSPLPPGLAKVEIQGRISAITASSVTVNEQLVLVTPATVLRFRSAPAVLADFSVGDQVHVRASRTTLAADASLEAIEIMLQNPARDDGDDADDDPGFGVTAVGTITGS